MYFKHQGFSSISNHSDDAGNTRSQRLKELQSRMDEFLRYKNGKAEPDTIRHVESERDSVLKQRISSYQ